MKQVYIGILAGAAIGIKYMFDPIRDKRVSLRPSGKVVSPALQATNKPVNCH